jgi:hypothetical protein
VAGTAIAKHGDEGGSWRNVTVIEHPLSDVTIHTGPGGETADTVGDLLPFSNPVFDAANEKQVGDDQGNCIRTRVPDPDKHVTGNYECNWTTNLPGGSITIEGVYLDAGPSTLAVIGGTGRYASARGSMDLAATADGNFSFAFHLR